MGSIPGMETEPDVYETPDFPINYGPQSSNPSDRVEEPVEGIDTTQVSSKDALKQFLDADSSNQDQSRPLNRTEYSYNRGVKTLIETPLERLQRLQFEINELANDLAAVDKEEPSLQLEQGNTASDILSHLHGLKSVLDRCETSLLSKDSSKTFVANSEVQNQLLQEIQAFGAGANDSKDKLIYELYCTSESMKANQAQQSAQLESRIANLEKIVGQTDSCPTPVVPMLDVLSDKLSVLDSEKLSSIGEQISTLNDLMSKNESSLKDSSSQQKLDKLFETMSQWDSTSEQLPTIVDRLVTLKSIHEQGSAALSVVSDIQSEREQVDTLLKNANANFERLANTFTENMKIIEENTKRLESRLDQISQRVPNQ